MEAIYVNGLSNQEIARKVVPERQTEQQKAAHVKLKDGSFVKLEINTFLGNPR